MKFNLIFANLIIFKYMLFNSIPTKRKYKFKGLSIRENTDKN